MVFEDITSTKNSFSDQHSGPFYYAAPADRLLSWLLDLALLFPFIYLLLSPALRELDVISFWGADDGKLALVSLISFVGAGLILFIYQVLCWALVGATAGQRLLGLQVRSLSESGKLSVYQALLRAGLWWLSLLLLATPFLECLTNPKGEALHDRGSASLVMSRQRKSFGAPSGIERSMLSASAGILAGTALLLVSILLAGLWASLTRGDDYETQANLFCQELPEEGPGNHWDGSVSPDADWKLSHYIAGTVNAQCLHEQADHELWEKASDLDYAYLLKAILTKEDVKLREKYLKKVCELSAEGQACRLAQLELAYDQKDHSTLQRLASMGVTGASPAFYASLLEKRTSLSTPSTLRAAVDGLSGIKGFESFLNHHLVRQLWEEGERDQARGALLAQLNQLKEADSLDQLAWFCEQERILDCSSQSKRICSEFNKKFLEFGSVQNPVWERAKVLDYACMENSPRTLSSWTKSLHSLDAKKYVLALSQARLSGRLSELLRIAHNRDSIFQREALLQLSQRPVGLRQLKSIAKVWREDIDLDLRWQLTGRGLLQLFSKFSETGEVLTIVQALEKVPGFEQSFLEPAVLALHHTGEKLQAYKLLQKHYRPSTVKSLPGRLPASSSVSFSDVLASLESEFGGL